MTSPKEIAEKILYACAVSPNDYGFPDIWKRVESLISEALEEARNSDFFQSASLETRIKGIADSIESGQSTRAKLAVLRNLCEQAKAEAYEEIAVMFDKCDTQEYGATADLPAIAKAIRQRAGEVGK